jgi:hypothetical protein
MCRFAEAEGLEEREFCIISNLGIQTSDEAKKLIPSLEVRGVFGFAVAFHPASN